MLKKCIFLSVLSFAIFAAGAFAQSNNEAKKLFNEGNALLKSGNFEGAVTKYDAALKLEKHEFFYYQRGLAMKKARKMDEALESFKSAVGVNPKWEIGYFALAGAYFSKGDYQNALENYELALKQNPTHGPSRKGLAAAQTARAQELLTRGETGNAIALCQKAVENDEKYDKAWVILAQAFNKDARYADAIQAAQNAIKHGNAARNGAAYFELGLAYRNQGNTAKAKDAFQKAKKDPSYARNAEYELKMLK
ncbi:MAG: tetratricopeptide repeat protein [Bacteroidetes bacterium]|nr:tetratricopeptide repeat protein [Bacteroidota bacterium]